MQLKTERLELRPFSPEAIDALLHHDGAALAGLVTGHFPEPPRPPALMEDILPRMRNRVRAEPSEAPWWAWTIVDSATHEVVGMLGMAGPPDFEGAVLLGYSIYEEFQGRSYASEAVRALAEWALAQPGVSVVRATIPHSHEASVRVAEKAGLRRAGRQADPQWGEVAVYELRKAGGVTRAD
ncbi:MAG TPA: GNAT family N-acetyltransferase [Gemmatimonadaceae bacterium]|nr:GNAT family N-acetyltransferase [Gemmatimonadaceae bacterium]